MMHLRIVAPREKAEAALELLEACSSVVNVIYLREVAHKPTLTLLIERRVYLRRRAGHAAAVAQRPRTLLYMPHEAAPQRGWRTRLRQRG